MELITKLNHKGIDIAIHLDNNTSIVTNSIKITSKHKQNALNKLANIECEFLCLARIERKKDKKKNFFNKHKK